MYGVKTSYCTKVIERTVHSYTLKYTLLYKGRLILPIQNRQVQNPIVVGR